MLSAQNLSYHYADGPRLTFPDLTCASGEVRLLLGSSGSGKTTMLQLLAGLRQPSTGHVSINGTDLTQLSTAARDQFRGGNLGMVFQTPHFVRSVSIQQNLRLAQQLSGHPVDNGRIADLLESLGLGQKANSLPSRLSVGQQQRAAIARAVINQPAVLLADEPTSALDDDNAQKVYELLRSQAEAVNAALLIVTHDNRLTALVKNQTTL